MIERLFADSEAVVSRTSKSPHSPAGHASGGPTEQPTTRAGTRCSSSHQPIIVGARPPRPRPPKRNPGTAHPPSDQSHSTVSKPPSAVPIPLGDETGPPSPRRPPRWTSRRTCPRTRRCPAPSSSPQPCRRAAACPSSRSPSTCAAASPARRARETARAHRHRDSTPRRPKRLRRPAGGGEGARREGGTTSGAPETRQQNSRQATRTLALDGSTAFTSSPLRARAS